MYFSNTLPWFMQVHMVAIDIQALNQKIVFAGLVGT